MLSLVIPTLNAEQDLERTLAALAPEGAGVEIVAADGGSRDRSANVAAAAGATCIAAPRGRGSQLRAGAQAASGAWLLFLHADTRLAPGWRAVVERFAAEPRNAERAAVFRLALDDADPRARRVERLAAWRGRALGLPYGDQGLLIARDFYWSLGGHPAIPLMEDVALVRRIGRRRLVLLDHSAITSAIRYRRGGWLRRPARNLALLSLYFFGVPPRLLARLYGR
ncbi:MAG: TIGR04283 family arsenosugar biosynthesis glycosyltransferase [Rhodospirillaceae bacterium]|nr:TIGR04283 family arsenosugar biosynthesis glycosyltransferase [Rhodospirillaceae bacterium]